MTVSRSSDGAAPACSVVVCTRDRPELLRETLVSLVKHLRTSDELIVVDSASRPGSVDEVADTVRNLGRVYPRVVRQDVPGASRARNAGLAAARAPLVAFTDDDCLVTQDWTTRIEGAFGDPAVGFVTGRVLGDSDVQLPLSLMVDTEVRRFEGPSDPADYGMGNNVAFRRSALLEVGGFDEAMGPGTPIHAAEDQDLMWRVASAGWAGVYDPAAIVIHRQWRGRGGSLAQSFRYGIGAGAVAIKAIRIRRREGWEILLARLWRDGVVRAIRDLQAGYEWGAVAGLVSVPGVAVGVLRGARLSLDGEHYGYQHRHQRRRRLFSTTGTTT
jgi:cellulose synthase/poly-beta-1,6-N-acetylglucosamine synthase-like glycosyltransferase